MSLRVSKQRTRPRVTQRYEARSRMREPNQGELRSQLTEIAVPDYMV